MCEEKTGKTENELIEEYKSYMAPRVYSDAGRVYSIEEVEKAFGSQLYKTTKLLDETFSLLKDFREAFLGVADNLSNAAIYQRAHELDKKYLPLKEKIDEELKK